MASRRRNKPTESSDGLVARQESSEYALPQGIHDKGSYNSHRKPSTKKDNFSGSLISAKRSGDTPPDSNRSKKLPSNVHYNDETLAAIFSEIKSKNDSSRPFMVFSDFLNILTRYRVDLNNKTKVSKDEYTSMAKFMYIQICNQALLRQ